MLMKTDDLGVPRFSNHDLIDMIYSGHIDKCHIVLCDPSDDIDQFNKVAEEHGISPLTKYIPLDVDRTEFDNALQNEWFMPEKYKKLNLGKLGIIHGDPILGNIIKKNNNELIFLDPRGSLQNNFSIYGDVNYDFAKIYQSLTGYENIISEKKN